MRQSSTRFHHPGGPPARLTAVSIVAGFLLIVTLVGFTGAQTAVIDDDATIDDETAELDFLAVDLGAEELEAGEETTAVVTAHFDNDTGLDVTDTATLSSSNAAIAEVSDDGLVRALEEGTTDIEAQYDDATASATLTVDTSSELSISTSVSTIDFNEVPVGESKTASLGLDNDGDQAYEATEITTSSASFSTAVEQFTLDPGESKTIDLTFSPDTDGLFENELVVDGDEEVRVGLGGVGILNDVSVEPETLEFDLDDPDEEVEDSIRIGADTEETLTVTVDLEGDGAISAETGEYTIDPDDPIQVAVSFDPPDWGAYRAGLTVLDDEGNTLAGATIEGVVEPDDDDAEDNGDEDDGEEVESSQLEFHFGAVDVGDAVSERLDVSLDSAIGSIDVSGDDADQFAIELHEDGTEDDLAIVEFTVDPDTTGNLSATFTVEFVDGTTQEGIVSAWVVDPDDVEPAPGEYDFGTVEVGVSVHERLEMPTDVAIESVEISGEHADQFSIDLREDASEDDRAVVEMGVEPDETGDLSADVTVEFADGTVEEGVVLATAVEEDEAEEEDEEVRPDPIEAPALEIEPLALRFEDAQVGETAEESVVFTNPTEEAIPIQHLELGPDPGEFTLPDNESFVLEPGEERSIVIEFAPDATESGATNLFVAYGDRPHRTVIAVSSGNVEREVTVDEQRRTRVNTTVREAEAGEEVAVDVPDVTHEEYHTEAVSVVPNRTDDVEIDVTTASEALDTTPEAAFEYANTTPLGFSSVSTNLEAEDIDEASMTTRIDRERLDELGVSPANVTLFQYDEAADRWVPRETELIEERGDALLYRMTADSFSEWAAGALQPEFSITDTEIDVTTATTDETVLINVIVTNEGGADGDYEASLILNDDVVDTEERTIPANSTMPINFERPFAEPGVYSVLVNDVFVDEVEVVDPDEDEALADEGDGNGPSNGQDDANDEVEDAHDDGGFGSLPMIVGLLLAIGIVAGLAYHFRDTLT